MFFLLPLADRGEKYYYFRQNIKFNKLFVMKKHFFIKTATLVSLVAGALSIWGEYFCNLMIVEPEVENLLTVVCPVVWMLSAMEWLRSPLYRLFKHLREYNRQRSASYGFMALLSFAIVYLAQPLLLMTASLSARGFFKTAVLMAVVPLCFFGMYRFQRFIEKKRSEFWHRR